MDWIGTLFAKLVEAFQKNRLSAIEQIEKTKARVLKKFWKRSKKKELKKLKKELTPEQFQEHIINEANENLEQQTPDQKGGFILERGGSETGN